MENTDETSPLNSLDNHPANPIQPQITQTDKPSSSNNETTTPLSQTSSQPPVVVVGGSFDLGPGQPVVSGYPSGSQPDNFEPKKSKMPLFIILGAILVLLLAGSTYLLAFNKSNKGSSPTPKTSSVSAPKSTPLPPANGTCLSAYKDANLCRYFANPALSTVPHIESSTQTESSSSITYVDNIDGNGNSQFTETASAGTISRIFVNNTIYFQQPGDSTYISYPASSAPQSTNVSNPDTFMTVSMNSPGVTFKFIDKENCSNLTCYKYKITSPSNSNVTQYIWIDGSKFLLQKWEYSTTTSSQSSTDSQGITSTTTSPAENITMTISYQSVTITAPPSSDVFPGNN